MASSVPDVGKTSSGEKASDLLAGTSPDLLTGTSPDPLAEAPRVNQVGIQYLSNDIHKKVFPKSDASSYRTAENPALLTLAQHHLAHNGLLGKKTQISDPINIANFPSLAGKSLDEHFHRIGTKSAEPYLQMAESFVGLGPVVPPRPKPETWLLQAGWTRYEAGKPPQMVPHPLEDELVFDVEVLYKILPHATLATAVSKLAWYGWVSPALVHFRDSPNASIEQVDFEHLMPFDSHTKPKLLVGYNVSFDRQRVLDEYHIKQSKAFYLDTMALHIAISGICSQQRPAWHRHRKSKSLLEHEDDTVDSPDSIFGLTDDAIDTKALLAAEVARELMDDPWLNKGAPNSLANVADFHCGIKLDKHDREFFATKDPQEIVANFASLMDYCAKDVAATYAVTVKLFPEFRRKVAHPVSFAVLRHMGLLMLPTTKKWDQYIEHAEAVFQQNRQEVTQILETRARELVRYIDEKDQSLEPEMDDWSLQLDWTLKQPRFKKNGDPSAKQAFMTGYPEWYRDLFRSSTDDNGTKSRDMVLTVRTRITPLLLKLRWEGYPLYWTDSCGWCFKVPMSEKLEEELQAKKYVQARLLEEDIALHMPGLRADGKYYDLYRIPHPDGPGKRTTSVLSKGYLRYFDLGVMTSEYHHVREILSLNLMALYWMGNRSRIMEQFVVYSDEKGTKNRFFDSKKALKEHSEMGIILPRLCTMGTITRRATENTWLTASNAKRNRIGSELKALVEAPKGYVFVGADVDSEELWIASLIGDSMFKMHGSTALGWMTLEGDKSEKTDLHSKTAEILGILRGDAKVFNYGRIYGAGVRFAARLLQQCNTSLSEVEAQELARELYSKTKGETSTSRLFDRKMYHGGTELVMFNALESIAHQLNPRTPVLGASITDALTVKYLNKNSYLTLRVNWTIQSLGVDYLHLLIISMEHLINTYKIDARLAITVHDELRYLVKEEDRYKAALLLQISNVWTRAMFCEQMGLQELPQSCAFFSEVDIDRILRKEVSLDCVTPSHPDSIPPGESWDIRGLLEKVDASFLSQRSPSGQKSKLNSVFFEPRDSVMSSLDSSLDGLKSAKLLLQNSIDKLQWRKNINLYLKTVLDEAQEKIRVVENDSLKTISKSTEKAPKDPKAAISKVSLSVKRATKSPLKEKSLSSSSVKATVSKGPKSLALSFGLQEPTPEVPKTSKKGRRAGLDDGVRVSSIGNDALEETFSFAQDAMNKLESSPRSSEKGPPIKLEADWNQGSGRPISGAKSTASSGWRAAVHHAVTQMPGSVSKVYSRTKSKATRLGSIGSGGVSGRLRGSFGGVSSMKASPSGPGPPEEAFYFPESSDTEQDKGTPRNPLHGSVPSTSPFRRSQSSSGKLPYAFRRQVGLKGGALVRRH